MKEQEMKPFLEALQQRFQEMYQFIAEKGEDPERSQLLVNGGMAMSALQEVIDTLAAVYQPKMWRLERFFFNLERKMTRRGGLSLAEARAWVESPEGASRTCTREDGIEDTKRYGPWIDLIAEDT